MRRLTSTSLLTLAFLTLRRWTAYELAEQVARGWADYWPRSVSGVYEEPKKLVGHGLATVTRERTGGRSRGVYAATAAGRRAVREWVGEPSEPPRLECEALLRAAFCDHADRDTLLAQIRSVGAFARERAESYAGQGRGYLDDGGPFPRRLHLNLLVGRFLAEHYAALARWSVWAQQEVGRWSGVADASVAPDVRGGLVDTVALFERTAGAVDTDGRVLRPGGPTAARRSR